jgi:hypothetical protein
VRGLRHLRRILFFIVDRNRHVAELSILIGWKEVREPNPSKDEERREEDEKDEREYKI